MPGQAGHDGVVDMDCRIAVFKCFLNHFLYDFPIQSSVSATKWWNRYAFDLVFLDCFRKFCQPVFDILIS